MSEFSEPSFLDEVEAITGEFLVNPRLDHVLRYQGVNDFPEELIDHGHSIYLGGLRVLAEERRKARVAGMVSADNAVQWNDRWANTLTAKRLGQIADDTPSRPELMYAMISFRADVKAQSWDYILHRPRPIGGGETTAIAPHQASAQMPKQSPEATPALVPTTNESTAPLVDKLRPHQHPYMDDIKHFLHRPPRQVKAKVDGTVRDFNVHGATALVPTGGGKTALGGKTVEAADIGKPHPEHPERNKRALIVASDMGMVEQFAGVSGDDTFRRFAPDGITIGHYHSRVPKVPKDVDVLIVTEDQFTANIKEGSIYGIPLDFLVIDEVHHLTAPQFMKSFLEQWGRRRPDGTWKPLPTVGFTATAEYDETKDVRDILPYTIEHADLISYMEEGVLNEGQFFLVGVDVTYTSDSLVGEDGRFAEKVTLSADRKEKLNATRHSMVDFFEPLIMEGRRGIIFCEPGDGAQNAKDLADSFCKLTLPNGEKVQARSINSTNSQEDNQKYRNDYHAGKIQVLTSVSMGHEGFNGAFDFVGVGNVTSLLRLRQIMGRGTRLSQEFPTTIYAQFITENPRLKTFLDALGLEEIDQGVIIGRTPVAGRTSRMYRDAMKAISIDDIPEALRPQVERINHHVMAEVFLREKVEIPPTYVPFEEIYKQVRHRVNESSAKSRLDAAGYAWVGEIVRGDKRTVRRYYEPNAESFFTKHPIPAKASSDEKVASKVATELGVSVGYIVRAYERLHKDEGLSTVNRTAQNGRVATHYGPELRMRLKEEVDKIPIANTTDEPPTTYAESIGLSEETLKKYCQELEITAVYKRRYGNKGFSNMITKAQQDAIKKRYEKYPWATDKQWTKARIAREAGYENVTIHKYLTDKDLENSKIMRARTEGRKQIRELRHWEEEIARAIVTRIRNRFVSLGSHLVPYTVAQRFINTPVGNPREAFLETEHVEKVSLPDTRPVLCITWDGLRKLYQERGLRQGIAGHRLPDFSRLPRGEHETEIERIIYARAFQLQHMTARRLGNPDGIID